jgi:hypothetical protein
MRRTRRVKLLYELNHVSRMSIYMDEKGKNDLKVFKKEKIIFPVD